MQHAICSGSVLLDGLGVNQCLLIGKPRMPSQAPIVPGKVHLAQYEKKGGVPSPPAHSQCACSLLSGHLPNNSELHVLVCFTGRILLEISMGRASLRYAEVFCRSERKLWNYLIPHEYLQFFPCIRCHNHLQNFAENSVNRIK